MTSGATVSKVSLDLEGLIVGTKRIGTGIDSPPEAPTPPSIEPRESALVRALVARGFCMTGPAPMLVISAPWLCEPVLPVADLT